LVDWVVGEGMTKIYGECVCGGAHAPATISDLAPDHCCVALETREQPQGELELWLGAVGPIVATADEAHGKQFTARFKKPLEPEIIAHFNA
jgi:hypothetical protein